MQNYLRKASLNRESKRYIRDKQVKDKESTVFVCFCFTPFFFSFSFRCNFLSQPIARNKLLLQTVLFWSSSSFDSLIQWWVNVNSLSERKCPFFPKMFFLTDSQQKGFYIHKYILSIFKLVTILEARVRHRVGKKVWQRPWHYRIPM